MQTLETVANWGFTPHGGRRGRELSSRGWRPTGDVTMPVKYHTLVDTLGLLLTIAVHRADIQDRDSTAPVLDKVPRALFPFLQMIFADGALHPHRPEIISQGRP